MNVAIVGSRDFTEDEVIYRSIDRLFSKYNGDLTIVSGGARGADSTAEVGATARGIPVTVFSPDWEGLGKRAGFVRNQAIVNCADVLLAFFAPGPRSRGTSHSVRLAAEKGIPVYYYHEGSWYKHSN